MENVNNAPLAKKKKHHKVSYRNRISQLSNIEETTVEAHLEDEIEQIIHSETPQMEETEEIPILTGLIRDPEVLIKMNSIASKFEGTKWSMITNYRRTG